MFSMDELTDIMGDGPTSSDEEQMAAGAAGSWEPSILAPSPPPPQPVVRPPQQLDLYRPTDIHDLPNEILHHVLKFLDRKNLYAAASVNKQWYDSVKKVHKIPRALPAPNPAPVFTTDLETAFASANGARWALDTGYEPTPLSLYVAAKTGAEGAVLVLLDYLLSKRQATILPATARVLGERGFFSCVEKIYQYQIPLTPFTTKPMFNGACKSGHIKIANYIISHGLPLFTSHEQVQIRKHPEPSSLHFPLAYKGLLDLSKGGHLGAVLRVIKKYGLLVIPELLANAAKMADLAILQQISAIFFIDHSYYPLSILFDASPGENMDYIMRLPVSIDRDTMEDECDEAVQRALQEGRRDILPFIVTLDRFACNDTDIPACYEYVNKTGDLDFLKFALDHSTPRRKDPAQRRVLGDAGTLEICLYLKDLIGHEPTRSSSYGVGVALLALRNERSHPTGDTFIASFECVKWHAMPLTTFSGDFSHFMPSLKAEEIKWIDDHLETPMEIDFNTFVRSLDATGLTSSEKYETLQYIMQRNNIDPSSMDYPKEFLFALDSHELKTLGALGFEARRAPLETIISAKKYDFMRYALGRGCTFSEPVLPNQLPKLSLWRFISMTLADSMETFMVLHETFIAPVQPQDDRQRALFASLQCFILSEAAKCGLQTMKKLYDMGYRWVNEADGRFHIKNLTYNEVKWMMSLGYRPVARLLRDVLRRGSVRFYKLIHDVHLALPYYEQYTCAENAKNWAVAEYIESSLLSPEQRAKITTPRIMMSAYIEPPRE